MPIRRLASLGRTPYFCGMTRTFFSLSVVALTLASSGRYATLSTLVAAPPRGTLLIVGGGPQPPALVKQFVELAGGPGRAKIVVFAQASVEGLKSGEEKAVELRALTRATSG